MKKTLFLLILSCASIIATAQTWDDTVRSIEKIFERYKPANPGAQLAISRNGQVIFSKAWGMADLEHNVPLTTTSVTEAGSVSKQFTAAAILLLEQEGKLSLNDDVRKYIPELPDYGSVITLRHMMQHTSGLKDWGAIASLTGWPRSTKTYNNDDALYITSLQKTLNHRPGAEYLYSNSNYNLFAVIVERVSGMSLADYSKKNIFEPAGMKNTQWRANYRKIVPNRAIAYAKGADGYLTTMPNEYVYGNGGLLTTAEDLLTWTHYYTSGKFGNPSLLQKQIAQSPLNSGIMNSYASGLFISKRNGADVIWHDGATAGYRAQLEHFPVLGLTIAWLSNTAEFDNAGSAIDAVRNVFIKPATVQNEMPPAITVSPEVLSTYAGWYRNTRSGSGLKLYIKDNKLQVQANTLTPIADGIFAVGANRFHVSADRRNMLFISPTKDSVYLTAVDSALLNASNMSDYVGEYYSDEVQATYFVSVKDGKLTIAQKPKAGITLTPTYKDGFDTPAGAVYFERDKRNKITGFKVSSGRARNVPFRKLR